MDKGTLVRWLRLREKRWALAAWVAEAVLLHSNAF